MWVLFSRESMPLAGGGEHPPLPVAVGGCGPLLLLLPLTPCTRRGLPPDVEEGGGGPSGGCGLLLHPPPKEEDGGGGGGCGIGGGGGWGVWQ